MPDDPQEAIEQRQLALSAVARSREPEEAIGNLRHATDHARGILYNLPPRVRGDSTRHVAVSSLHILRWLKRVSTAVNRQRRWRGAGERGTGDAVMPP